MNLIDILGRLGGVKECPRKLPFNHDLPKYECELCHGTGQVLDLAPLLAKPKELESVLRAWVTFLRETDASIAMPSDTGSLYVVGPQRAHSLVYEVARQLGGTAVMAEPVQTIELESGGTVDVPDDYEIRTTGYRLSLPIPPDATVLFVTDRMDATEMTDVIETVARSAQRPCEWKYLTYVLCLVNNLASFDLRHGPHEGEWKVISLHQEKP